MEDTRTELERDCCHMGVWGLDGQTVEQWREEFSGIARTELCRDCPIFTGKRLFEDQP